MASGTGSACAQIGSGIVPAESSAPWLGQIFCKVASTLDGVGRYQNQSGPPPKLSLAQSIGEIFV